MSSLALADVPALILAGGLGTRLRGAVPDQPKVLAPVLGRPFVTHVLDLLAATALRRVVLLTGHRAGEVERSLGNRYRTLSLSYVRETTPLGTGGAVRHALTHVPERRVLLLNGDSYCGVDLDKLVSFHRRSRGDLSMVVTRVADTSRYGQVQFAALGRNRIDAFVEKGGAGGAGWINAGVSVIERRLLETIPLGQPHSLERDSLPRWIASRTLLAFPARAPFLDIGTPASYAAAEEFFARLGKERPHAVPA